MTQRIDCEFYLIRYVPNIVRGEFINIGVILRCSAASAAQEYPEQRWANTLVRFTRTWDRVMRLDPSADIEFLTELSKDIERRLTAENGGVSEQPLIESLLDSLSNTIQITGPNECHAASLSQEIDLLAYLYIESAPIEPSPPPASSSASRKEEV